MRRCSPISTSIPDGEEMEGRERGIYSDSGISFEFTASTKTSELRAMFEHAFLTSCNARSENSFVIAVLTPGRTYMYGR